MVFGLFSRKTQPAGQKDPQVPSPHAQLRTPSPSAESSAVAGSASPARPADYGSPTVQPPATPSPPPADAPDAPTLRARLAAIPPKIMHEYALAHLAGAPSPSPPTLSALATFFAGLRPPPRLHCVRCHKGFFEVENDEHSCLIPHDDESAEVERVGARGKDAGTEYETLWGCCGRTVEGDGDMGPPDGWCYEGKHTTDPKRARFRADSTVHDDKLVSCARRRCHDVDWAVPRGRSTRVRKRTLPDEFDDVESDADDDESAGASDSGVDDIASIGGSARKSKAKKVAKPKSRAKKARSAGDDGEEAMDVDDEAGDGDQKKVLVTTLPLPDGMSVKEAQCGKTHYVAWSVPPSKLTTAEIRWLEAQTDLQKSNGLAKPVKWADLGLRMFHEANARQAADFRPCHHNTLGLAWDANHWRFPGQDALPIFDHGRKWTEWVKTDEGIAWVKLGRTGKDGVSLKKESASPKKEGASPKKEGASPKKGGASPKMARFAPAQEVKTQEASDSEAKRSGSIKGSMRRRQRALEEVVSTSVDGEELEWRARKSSTTKSEPKSET